MRKVVWFQCLSWLVNLTSGHQNFCRPLNPDWSIQISRAPAVCKASLSVYFQCRVQPRSQGLSSLPPLVVGRKTLVAAGHVPSCDTNFSTGVGSPTIFVDLNWSERKVLRSKFSSPVVSFTQVRWDILICIYLAYQPATGRSVYY